MYVFRWTTSAYNFNSCFAGVQTVSDHAGASQRNVHIRVIQSELHLQHPFGGSTHLLDVQQRCRRIVASLLSCAEDAVEFKSAAWLDNDQPVIQTSSTPQERLGQKELSMTFRSCLSASMIREHQLKHSELQLQQQRLLVGQAAYTVDELAVKAVFPNGIGKPKGHWVTLPEILSLDATGVLSVDSSQRLRSFCQKWVDAGWSLDQLGIVANWLRQIRRDPAHQLSRLAHTSAADLLSCVPACCQAMGRKWNQPEHVPEIRKLITTLRDEFTNAEAVLHVRQDSEQLC